MRSQSDKENPEQFLLEKDPEEENKKSKSLTIEAPRYELNKLSLSI